MHLSHSHQHSSTCDSRKPPPSSSLFITRPACFDSPASLWFLHFSYLHFTATLYIYLFGEECNSTGGEKIEQMCIRNGTLTVLSTHSCISAAVQFSVGLYKEKVVFVTSLHCWVCLLYATTATNTDASAQPPICVDVCRLSNMATRVNGGVLEEGDPQQQCSWLPAAVGGHHACLVGWVPAWPDVGYTEKRQNKHHINIIVIYLSPQFCAPALDLRGIALEARRWSSRKRFLHWTEPAMHGGSSAGDGMASICWGFGGHV